MKTLEVHIASPLRADPVEPVSIVVCKKITNETLEDQEVMRGHFAHDVFALAEALRLSLPAATLERLVGELLKQQASDYLGVMLLPAPSPSNPSEVKP